MQHATRFSLVFARAASVSLVTAVVLLPAEPVRAATEKEREPSETSTIVETAERSSEGVVVIKVKSADGEHVGQASGFVVEPSGAIATCLHVLDGAGAVIVKTTSKRFTNVFVQAFDATQDVALLRVDAVDLSALPLGDSSELRVGDPIVTIGHPLGLTRTVTEGVISGWREPSEWEPVADDEEFETSSLVRGLPRFKMLQISAAVSPGSSGGPVFDRSGRVIGLAAGGFAYGALGLNFAIPIEALTPLLEINQGLDLESFQKRADEQRAYLAEPHLAEARLALELGDTDLAERQLEEALALHPRFVDALLLRASLLELQGDLGAAASLLLEATQIDPESSDAWYELGKFHMTSALGEALTKREVTLGGGPRGRPSAFDVAIEAFRAALELDDSHAGALYGIGTLLQTEGRLRMAREMFERAIESDPDLLEAGIRLGEALMMLDAHEAAEAAYEAVLERDGTSALAHRGLARAYAAQHNHMAARRHWRLFLELSEDDPSLEVLRERTLRYLERYGREALPRE